MPAHHVRLLVIGMVLAMLGTLAIAVFEPAGDAHVVLGLMFGTMFGQTTLAAAWTCFGPVAWWRRWPLGIAWIATLVAALAINASLHGGGPTLSEIMTIMLCCLGGQWLLVQIPLWGLRLGYGLRWLHRSDAPAIAGRWPQFGLRQMLLFTTAVAVLLGVGRLAVTKLALQFHFTGETEIFVFLAVAAVAMSLPLLLAALLPRMAIVATLFALLLVSVATAWELPLLTTFHRGPGPDAWHLVWINAFTAAWILVGILLVRANGYRLTAGLAKHE